MTNFKDLGIVPNLQHFTGDKIKIDRIVNKEITVHGYKLAPSKFEKGSGKCLNIQIEVNGTKHVVFSGSSVLIDMIERVPKTGFPFRTVIERQNDHFEFT